MEKLMSTEEIFGKLRECIINGNKKDLIEAVDAGLSENLTPLDLIDKMTDVMKEVGEKFENGEAFLPEMIKAADAWKVAVAKLEPKLAEDQVAQKKVGRIVMGTVQGDMHDLGKNIVVAFLKTVGFEIMDVGIDASPSKLIDAAKEFDADIIGASALLTTTMPYQKALIEHLEARNLRDKFKVIVGGGPVNQEWAGEIGADGYANDAAEAAKLCVSMMAD
jgi:corrinoid protein of di/trimethylamine methyltransferase